MDLGYIVILSLVLVYCVTGIILFYRAKGAKDGKGLPRKEI